MDSSAWVPTYFLRAHGWNIGETGRALGFLILPFGCLGLYLGGWLSERWQKRGMIGCACCWWAFLPPSGFCCFWFRRC